MNQTLPAPTKRSPEKFEPRPLTWKTRLLAWLIHTLARLIYAADPDLPSILCAAGLAILALWAWRRLA